MEIGGVSSSSSSNNKNSRRMTMRMLQHFTSIPFVAVAFVLFVSTFVVIVVEAFTISSSPARLSSSTSTLSSALFSSSSPSSSSSSSAPSFNNNIDHTRGMETSQHLDASRFHFQILFVDDDNTMGRIAEGLLARIAEYNDALFVLFPSSATLITTDTTSSSSSVVRMDGTPPSHAIQICQSLDLCPTRSTDIGTVFDISSYETIRQYDLILCMNEHVRLQILQQVYRSSASGNQDDDEFVDFAYKCRSISEFVNFDFVQSIDSELQSRHQHPPEHPDPTQQEQDDIQKNKIDNTHHGKNNKDHHRKIVERMLETDLLDRVTPFLDAFQQTSFDAESIFQNSGRSAMMSSSFFSNTKSSSAATTTGTSPPSLLVWDDDTNTAIPNPQCWSVCEAALILSIVGVTKFCLDTIQLQMEDALDDILSRIITAATTTATSTSASTVDSSSSSVLASNTNTTASISPINVMDDTSPPLSSMLEWNTVEEQLTKCNAAVCGYFSPKQRFDRFRHYCERQRYK